MLSCNHDSGLNTYTESSKEASTGVKWAIVDMPLFISITRALAWSWSKRYASIGKVVRNTFKIFVLKNF